MTNSQSQPQSNTVQSPVESDPPHRTRAQRVTAETGHPETVTDVLETCRRTYRDDLASDIEHLLRELELSQFGLTTNWLDMPTRDGEDAYALMMAFRAGVALGATTDTPTDLVETGVPSRDSDV